jgi:hypothetical protein
MVKINLTEPRSDWRKKLAIAFVSLSFLGLCALALPVLSRHWSEPRSLQIEEQEIVLAVAQRLEGRVPKLAEWLEDFRYSVAHNDFELLYRHTWRAQKLVHPSGRTLYFSSQFFDADSANQEQALLGVIVTLRSQIEPESDVAFAGE